MITATYIGEGTLSYQWKKNGKNITGRAFPRLHIQNAHRNDEGSYSCVVSNEARLSVESAQAKLEVGVCPDCKKRVYRSENQPFNNMDYHKLCLLKCKDCGRTLRLACKVIHNNFVTVMSWAYNFICNAKLFGYDSGSV